MHFLNCYHPVKIIRYGETHYVPCGKCDYCKHVRNQSMSKRLACELKTHKYNVFVTLTYSNTFIPKFKYIPRLNSLVMDTDSFLHGCDDSGLFIDTSNFSDYEINHIHKLENKLGFVPVLRRKDVQDFIKRLRRFIDYNLIRILLKHGKITLAQKSDYGIFYSFCGEYGPSNFRPHYHGIISFEKKELALMFSRLLSKSWPFGRVSYKFVSDENHVKYISEYVNCSYRLPKFYQRYEIRPFRLFSKSHPVGFNSISEKEISRIFRDCAPTMFFKDLRGVDVETPLWACIENKLFPRFVAYNQIDSQLREEIISDALSYDSFKDYVRSKSCYLPLPFEKSSNLINFLSPFDDYFSMVNREVQDLGLSNRLVNSALYSIYYCSNIIKSNMERFNVPSVHHYLIKIDRYLYNVAQYRLKQQMLFENTWYKSHPDWLKFLDIGGYDIDDILNNTSDMDKIYSEIQTSIYTSHKNRAKTDYKANCPYRNSDKYITSTFFSGLDNY